MAKKKRVRVARRAPVRRAKSARASAVRNRGFVKGGRLRLVVKNLILFVILFIICVVVGKISNNELVDNLFWILAILTGFVGAALLIALLVLLFMRQMKK